MIMHITSYPDGIMWCAGCQKELHHFDEFYWTGKYNMVIGALSCRKCGWPLDYLYRWQDGHMTPRFAEPHEDDLSDWEPCNDVVVLNAHIHDWVIRNYKCEMYGITRYECTKCKSEKFLMDEKKRNEMKGNEKER
jgi:hypothetical protein